MANCPNCNAALPKMTMEDALLILEELKQVPGFMRKLGEETAKAYLKEKK